MLRGSLTIASRSARSPGAVRAHPAATTSATISAKKHADRPKANRESWRTLRQHTLVGFAVERVDVALAAVQEVEPVHPRRARRTFQPVVEPLVEVHRQYFCCSRPRMLRSSLSNENRYASLPSRRIAVMNSIPWNCGTAPSSSLWMVRYGVVMFLIPNSPEFSR